MVGKMLPKDFWDFIDETEERLMAWVSKNKVDINYEACGLACNVMYRILIDWDISKRCGIEDIDEVIRIAAVDIRGVGHFVVTVLGNWFFDPTHMQFNPRPTASEYSEGWMYDDYFDDCKKIFEDDGILEVCKEIRPELYR